mmetsp:Transcript_6863/g.21463  ORF Transcript_6863/g.21463 Transcript_6863/m.21463 type:complete len:108 (-) Transcript_6863:311-634(-)
MGAPFKCGRHDTTNVILSSLSETLGGCTVRIQCFRKQLLRRNNSELHFLAADNRCLRAVIVVNMHGKMCRAGRYPRRLLCGGDKGRPIDNIARLKFCRPAHQIKLLL